MSSTEAYSLVSTLPDTVPTDLIFAFAVVANSCENVISFLSSLKLTFVQPPANVLSLNVLPSLAVKVTVAVYVLLYPYLPVGFSDQVKLFTV